MNIIELRKKLLQQSLTAQKLQAKHKISYQSVILGCTKDMNNQLDTLIDEKKISDNDSFYQRFFLTDNEKKLLQDIYLSDFDELIDFDE